MCEEQKCLYLLHVVFIKIKKNLGMHVSHLKGQTSHMTQHKCLLTCHIKCNGILLFIQFPISVPIWVYRTVYPVFHQSLSLSGIFCNEVMSAMNYHFAPSPSGWQPSHLATICQRNRHQPCLSPPKRPCYLL